MPTRSQSGSVAKSRSGRTVSASFKAHSKACRISGLGKGAVGKRPSGSSCSGTTVTLATPIRSRMARTGLLPVPCRGV